jgi:uncharacterized protein with GYD domain
MAKYLWEVNYSAAGASGLLKEGGTSRLQTIEKLLANLGGKLDTAYYSFGDVDLYVIVDIPDSVTAAAVSLTVGAAGSASIRTRVLLDPKDIDAATKKTVEYRAPGK